MIRINLLSVERRAQKSAALDSAQRITLLCSLILVGSAIAIGYWFWSLRAESTQLDQDIAAARQETARLATVLRQVERFESRKQQLEQRVLLIEQLRKGQSGPVHLLDQISRSLPDRMWLTQLKQEGTALTIEGRASSLTALSDFVGNLEASPFFKRPVEIMDSQLDPQPQGELIKFVVKAEFATPAAAEAPGA